MEHRPICLLFLIGLSVRASRSMPSISEAVLEPIKNFSINYNSAETITLTCRVNGEQGIWWRISSPDHSHRPCQFVNSNDYSCARQYGIVVENGPPLSMSRVNISSQSRKLIWNQHGFSPQFLIGCFYFNEWEDYVYPNISIGYSCNAPVDAPTSLSFSNSLLTWTPPEAPPCYDPLFYEIRVNLSSDNGESSGLFNTSNGSFSYDLNEVEACDMTVIKFIVVAISEAVHGHGEASILEINLPTNLPDRCIQEETTEKMSQNSSSLLAGSIGGSLVLLALLIGILAMVAIICWKMHQDRVPPNRPAENQNADRNIPTSDEEVDCTVQVEVKTASQGKNLKHRQIRSPEVDDGDVSTEESSDEKSEASDSDSKTSSDEPIVTVISIEEEKSQTNNTSQLMDVKKQTLKSVVDFDEPDDEPTDESEGDAEDVETIEDIPSMTDIHDHNQLRLNAQGELRKRPVT